MIIRPRHDDDFDELTAIAARVHDHDGYPRRVPPAGLLDFLTRAASIAAFVAVHEGRTVGHVAVNTDTSPAAMEVFRQQFGDAPLGVVARLLVDTTARRIGAGRALLDHATAWAWQDGRQPVLDVVASSAGPVALYRAQGWVDVGQCELMLGSGQSVAELLFAAPARPETTITRR